MSLVRTWSCAALLSGLPSTLVAAARRHSVFEATRAAGAIVGRPAVPTGVAVHAVVSLGWTVVITTALRGRRNVVAGTAMGALIALVDLELLGPHIDEIRDLDRVPQYLDHLAFGMLVGAGLPQRPSRTPPW